ncbi:hypothetical protein ACHAWF_008881 [Thalassiosira exigua]
MNSLSNAPDARHPDPVDDEIYRGLLAAKRYENDKPRLPPEVQRDLIDENFPSVPRGDVAPTLSESECLQLRASTVAAANERTSRGMANLREQLTEYHALLDELSAMTERYDALEERYKLRGRRIQLLERQVAAMSKGGGPRARSGPRRVSCCGVQGCGSRCGRAGAPPPPGGRSPIQKQVLGASCPSLLPATIASPSLLPATQRQCEKRGHLLGINGLPSDPPGNEAVPPQAAGLASPSPTRHWLSSRDAIDGAPSRLYSLDLDPNAQIQQELTALMPMPERVLSQGHNLHRGNELPCRPCVKRPRIDAS